MNTTATQPEARPIRLVLSLAETAAALSIGRTKLWQITREDPSFPKPIEISAGRKGFVLADIEAWVRSRAEARSEVAA